MPYWREVRQTGRLAAPLILGQLAAISINFVDTVMAGHYDALTLAGVAIGGAVWSAAMMMMYMRFRRLCHAEYRT